MLTRSGIGPILGSAGYRAVGSYSMRTMTWRDLDFERMEEPSWERHWEVGNAIADTGWCFRMNCVDMYRSRWQDFGLYWGLRASDPACTEVEESENAVVWKLDLWTARPEEFAPGLDRRQTWESLMSDEARSHILAIKEAVSGEFEYRKTMLSVHVYEAVLEHGICDLVAFREWWATRYEGK
jgi:hypothetical protein